MRFICASALLMLSLFLGTAVLAATVQPVEGDVLINRGSGYEPVSGPTQAKVGDSVMASPGGSARVVYDDQCSVAVKPGRVVAIAPEPPCKKMASFDPDGTRMNAGLAPGKAFHEPPPRRNWLPVALIGAQFVVVGLCIGDVICDDPVSK